MMVVEKKYITQIIQVCIVKTKCNHSIIIIRNEYIPKCNDGSAYCISVYIGLYHLYPTLYLYFPSCISYRISGPALVQ